MSHRDPRRALTIAAAAGGLVLAGLVAGPPATAAPSSSPCGSTGTFADGDIQSCTYDVVGSDTFKVPAGVTVLDLTVTGGAGGHWFFDGRPDSQPGGAGGQVAGKLVVAAGQVLQVDVAGAGENGTAAQATGGQGGGPSGGSGAAGGFGGSNGGVPHGPGDAAGGDGGSNPGNGGNGSGGGGSSDVRFATGGCAALTCGLATRLLVAPGGGGAGGNGGQANAVAGGGGAGGGATGEAGWLGAGGNAAPGGEGGSQSAGGLGGDNPNTVEQFGGADGDPGVLGSGGAGGDGNGVTTGGVSIGGGAGGGAGAGYYGGGGGAGGGGPVGGGGGSGGGGGGGSAYAAANIVDADLEAGSNDGAINEGNGRVVISWTKPEPSDSTPPFDMTVKARPSLTLKAGPKKIVAGQTRTKLRVRLSSAVAPTGRVTATFRGKKVGSAKVVGGKAVLKLKKFKKAGKRKVVVVYGGDARNNAATTTIRIKVRKR